MDKKEALKQIKAGDFSLADADEKLRADKKIVIKALKGLSKILVGSVTLKTEDVLVMQKFQKA